MGPPWTLVNNTDFSYRHVCFRSGDYQSLHDRVMCITAIVSPSQLTSVSRGNLSRHH
jgi:hypothetical protein